MSSKEKEEFSARMNEVADDLGIPEKGKNRQKALGDKFHVSQEAARKWLTGEGFPSTEKSIEIVKLAEVNYEWFMTGRGPKKFSVNTIPPEVKEWLLKNVTSAPSPEQADQPDEIAKDNQPRRLGDERRQRENSVNADRRQSHWFYKRGGKK